MTTIVKSEPKPILAKPIIFCGSPVTLVCDGKCGKAWGLNNRPRVQLSADPDDYYFLADGELADAPADPGTSEGGHGKPCTTTCVEPLLLNKWCARECERSRMLGHLASVRANDLPDFTVRRYNIPSSAPTEKVK